MPLKWRKVLIADELYESAGVFDVNGSGALDIVSGAWWYEGPDFKRRHPVGEIVVYGEYYDSFSTVPLDVNGDGLTDFVDGSWFDDRLRWRENPGDPDAEWPEHVIAEVGNIETTRGHDVDGCGTIEIIPNTPGHPLVMFKLKTGSGGRGTGEFAKHVLLDAPSGHGLGFGDVAGNGRSDIVLANGWLEAPADPLTGEWTLHEDFDLGSASVPILVVDVTGNGVNDLIVGGAHAYGLTWVEHSVSGGDTHTWVKHPIDPFNSQYHDLMWVDVDGDGQCELVTGKRYRAHNGKDPGSGDDVSIYYFKWNGEGFSKQVIDYGPPRLGTGPGIHFAMADLSGNGLPDIIAPGKDGLYVFYNEGP